MNIRVVVTKGAHTGKTGTASPSRAIGPVGQPTFLVLVVLDDGTGTIELPLDAVDDEQTQEPNQ